jgi:hypothetical protein
MTKMRKNNKSYLNLRTLSYQLILHKNQKYNQVETINMEKESC